MRAVVFIFIFLFEILSAKTPFISNEEYAKMLYKNPRGIGCHKCHGERGEGGFVASYINRDKKKITLIGPQINNLSDISLKRFEEVLDHGTKLMPKYFLTSEEKAYLYYYLAKQKQTKKRMANVDTKK